MFQGRIVQLAALVVMVLSLTGSGWLLPRMLDQIEANTLRYTDVSEESLPPELVLGKSIGALRGIIVDVLWVRATIMKEKGLYYESNTLAEMITKLQPRFAPVWAFLGHNMAYNISVATDTQEERWEWVNKGIDLVRNDGLRYNPDDVELHKELSFWFMHKIEGISDDAHLYYKRQFCREWHRVLGPPPADWSDRIAWIKKVADAPNSREALYALDDSEDDGTPGPKELVERLRTEVAPFERLFQFDLDREFLYAYSDWKAVDESWYTQTLQTRKEIERRAAEEDDVSAQFFLAFDEIAADPEYAEAWDQLLAFVRKKVLRERYNMDAQLMYELTEKWGPIDWRHGSAHTLYWSRRGARRAELRFQNEELIYKIINNDRMAANAMQDLARFGNISYDPASNDMPSRLPDPRWIGSIDRFFEHLYVKHQDVRGWGSDNFIAWHQNFMESSMRELWRMGNKERAEEIRQMLDERYGTGHVPPNPQYAKPIDVLVKEETFKEYDMQPHVATTDVQNAMYYAIRAGLARGDREQYEEVKKFANEVLQYFRVNEYNNFVNKFGEARIHGIISDLQNVEVATYWRIMVDSTIPLRERLMIYNLHTPDPIKRQIYDSIKPTVESHVARSRLRDYQLGQVLPEPPGMEAFRAAREAELQRQREQEQQVGQGERATIDE